MSNGDCSLLLKFDERECLRYFRNRETALRWRNTALKAKNIQAQGETLGAMARRRASPERAAHKNRHHMSRPFRAFDPQQGLGIQGFALGLYVTPFQGSPKSVIISRVLFRASCDGAWTWDRRVGGSKP